MENTLLNLIPAAYLPEIHLSQYDVGRTITFTLKDGASDYSVPSGASVKVKATKPSGFGFEVACTFNGGTVTLVTTDTMTPENGRFPAELSIVSGNTTIGTSNFIFNIERSPHPEGTIDGDAETIIPELTLLVERIENSNARIESMTASATTLATGEDATAEYNPVNNQLVLGLPRGEKGEQGEGVASLEPRVSTNENAINVLDARMDTFASLPSGSTSGNAELLDIRVGTDGTTYPSAGDAVRVQIADLNDYVAYNPSLEWVVGGISNGADVARSDRIRTTTHIDLKLLKLIKSNNLNYTTSVYNEFGTYLGNYPSDFTKANTTDANILGSYPSAGYIRIICASTTTDDASKIIVSYSAIKEKEQEINAVNDVVSMHDSMIETSKNIFNADFVQGIIDGNTGAFTRNANNTNTAEEKYIPVVGGKTYVFSWINAGLGDQYMYVHQYTSDKTCKGSSYRITINIGTLKYKAITFDSDVAFIRLHVYKGGTSNWENLIPKLLQIEVGTFPTSYLKNKVVKGDSINVDSLLPVLNKNLKPMTMDKVVDKFQVVAYSSLYDDIAPINSKEHFVECARMSFDGIKGDIAITSDGHLIMCHDKGYTFDANNKITTFDENNNTPIRNLTYEQVKALTFAMQHNGQDVHPADIDDFLFVAKKYGKFPYIVIRDQYMNEVVPTLVSKLYFYGLESKCIINSFTLASIQAVRAVDDQITLSQVTNYKTSPTNAFVDNLALLGNAVLCIFDDGTMIETNADIVEYARSLGVHVWGALVTNTASVLDDYLKAGYSGVQSMIEYDL